MDNCRQACPYNTLDGCKVKEYSAICPLTNMATPITEQYISEVTHWIPLPEPPKEVICDE